MVRTHLAMLTLSLAIALTCAASQPVSAQTNAEAPPRMLALLIGNSDYNRDGRVTLEAPQGNHLRDLATPCTDIERVRDALEMLAPPGEIEITAVCNLTAAQIREQVDLIASRMTEVETDPGFDLDGPPVLLIYFAGHGIQLGPRNYLFGVGAQPNLQRAARQFLDRPNRTLLTAEAAELNTHIVTKIKGERFGSPIFIVIDACREDAVPIEAPTLAGRAVEIGTVGIVRDTARDFAIPGANGSAAQPGQDMLIAFSTSGGAKAHDHSGYAEAFASFLSRRDLTATEIFVEVRRQVLSNTRGQQVPSEIVGLMQHYCFAGCDAAEPRQAAYRPPTATLPYVDRPAGWMQSIHWQRDAANPDQPSLEIFYTPPAPANARAATRELTRFDVFYCAAADAGARHGRARAIAAAIRDLPGVSLRGRRAEVGTIRIRRLSERANARPGYQITRDEVRFEPLDAVEVDWARQLTELDMGLASVRVANSTPDYVSVFVCGEGPPTRS